MKIIQHRVNNLAAVKTAYVEVDVQYIRSGDIYLGHSLDSLSCGADEFLRMSPAAGYFVNVKQSLDLRALEEISELFGNRLIGLFDVPWPSAYYAMRANLPVYERISEYEKPSGLSKHFWVDPLVKWTVQSYRNILDSIPIKIYEAKCILAAPSLHLQSLCSFCKGVPLDMCPTCPRGNPCVNSPKESDIILATWLKAAAPHRPIEGVVTKYPAEVDKCSKL